MIDEEIPKNEEGWKKLLTPEQFDILREGKTEAPFTGTLLKEKRSGAYKCAACGQELFSSDTKFDSGTGWPSFDQALPGAIEYKEDNSFGDSRIEAVCSRCKSHLGHVFDDGPPETTGKRFCMNSACLLFEEKKNEENK